ncbi:MAG: heat-inducible transcriptional repressor HrcA [Actinomycetota bacterium]|nr:heat-inducible transcriptional repressor HrcA [Actinomycetota bacterium]
MAGSATRVELTQRQRDILRRVVEEHVKTGQPVGSKNLVERSGLSVSPSTVRAELGELEALGLLTHPHTSAGRVPTEQGYRFYVDTLLQASDGRPSPLTLDLTTVRTEVEAALQATTEMLSQVTHLLALVSAPPLETTTIRHVEVLPLQPHLVMVVVITSTGGVTKRMISFDEPVDVGLVSWAAEYLNERVAGHRLGASVVRQRLEDPALSLSERTFMSALRPVFTDAVASEQQQLFVGGAAGLLADFPADELAARHSLLEALEKRAALLQILRAALDPRRTFVRVGEELENPAFRDVALVGASYGLATRSLGTVSLLGPVRMDYDMAIRSVRAAALELSRFVEEVYAEN